MSEELPSPLSIQSEWMCTNSERYQENDKVWRGLWWQDLHLKLNFIDNSRLFGERALSEGIKVLQSKFMKPSSQAEPVELRRWRLKYLRVVSHDDVRWASLAHFLVNLIHFHPWVVATRLSCGNESWFFRILSRLEHFPEAQSFICSSTCHSGAIGTHSQMKDSACVTSEVSNLFHLWILPDAELIVYEAMRREDLSIEGIPLKSADLWFSLNWLNEAAWVGVPKLDWLVSWTTAWCQEMPLPWAPS